jgi:hypothetical protein
MEIGYSAIAIASRKRSHVCSDYRAGLSVLVSREIRRGESASKTLADQDLVTDENIEKHIWLPSLGRRSRRTCEVPMVKNQRNGAESLPVSISWLFGSPSERTNVKQAGMI